MRRNGWHIFEEGGALVMARRRPVRFDLSVESAFPELRRRKLALQIRQDLWRALADLRGFAPVVRVARHGDGLRVTAGGQVDGAVPRGVAEGRIGALLESPAHRARWIRWASS